MKLNLIGGLILFMAATAQAAGTPGETDCAKLLLATDVKAVCGAIVTVQYAQPISKGCSVMLQSAEGDSVRLEVTSFPPDQAKALFDFGNPATEKDKKDVAGLGDRAHQYHLTNLNVDKLDVLMGSQILSMWSGKKEKAQVCSLEQMQKLAKTVLGRLPK